jgi:hypothetical protein
MYKFVEKQSKQRLIDWYNFRQQLEQSKSPLEDTANYFSNAPRVKIYTDPYDQLTWPTAWQLIDENEYCQFNILLGICYTLQLTKQFQDTTPLIKIAIDKFNKTVYYLLFVDDKVYGFSDDGWISAKTLPKTLNYLKIYPMPPLH